MKRLLGIGYIFVLVIFTVIASLFATIYYVIDGLIEKYRRV